MSSVPLITRSMRELHGLESGAISVNTAKERGWAHAMVESRSSRRGSYGQALKDHQTYLQGIMAELIEEAMGSEAKQGILIPVLLNRITLSVE